jgi:hypothetical protein
MAAEMVGVFVDVGVFVGVLSSPLSADGGT